MFIKKQRIKREKTTVKAMVKIYCRDQHKSHKNLCHECSDLLNYAKRRLNSCPFQEGKTTCANCKVHCYKPMMRENIRTVMQYAGPHITYRHPLLALFHFIDGFRKEPIRNDKRIQPG